MGRRNHVGRGIVVVLAAVTAMLLVGQMAWAGNPGEGAIEVTTLAPSPRVAVEGLALRGGSVPKIGIFNADDDAYYLLPAARPFAGAPCMVADTGENGYTPVENGGIDTDGNGLWEQSDAFDGGLYVEVNKKIFLDSDGAVSGQQLKTSDKLDRFNVVRIERALASGPILRSLIQITNPSNKTRTAKVTVDSAMGADDLEATRASSSGDLAFTTADRWFVASDNAGVAGDTPIVMAVSGTGAPVGLKDVIWAPEADSSTFCQGAVVFRYKVRIAAKSKAILMLFTELQDTNANAIAAANKYNKKKLSADLQDGLTGTQKARIVNFVV